MARQGGTSSLFEHQGQLKQLPVPELEETLSLYVQTVRPLLSEQERKETEAKVRSFAQGDGPKLHAMLVAKANAIDQGTYVAPVDNEPNAYPDDGSSLHPEGEGSRFPNTHWLEEWWERLAYQSDRTSVAVNINCFQSHFHATPCEHAPLLRAAWLIKAEMHFHKALLAGDLPPDSAGKSVQCSAQYLRFFSTTRVPGPAVDRLHTWKGSRHACIERRGYWYVIEDVDTLSVAQILDQLEFIKRDAETRQSRGPGVGAFTATERDVWAANRARLLAVAPEENARALRLLESAVFHLVLSEATPKTRDELHTIGQCGSANGEIWFDKSHTNIVCDNGMTITNLEHSAADAVCPAKVFVAMDEYIQRNAPYLAAPPSEYKMGVTGFPIPRESNFKHDNGALDDAKIAAPKRVEFVLDAGLGKALVASKETLAKLADDNIVTCLMFPDFGAKSISKECKGISSDSFMQVSLALAYFRDQKELPVTYETATTRGFLHGRTETIRPQSLEMREFIENFEHGALSRAQLADLVRKAGNHHRNYTRHCMVGKGVDRHLLAMRILAAENGMVMPDIFTDKAYTKSTRFTLSTSQMPWAVNDCPGFGAYDNVAYACCYRFTHANTICATVASRKHTGGGKDAVRFSETIKQSMRDVFRLLRENPPVKAKL